MFHSSMTCILLRVAIINLFKCSKKTGAISDDTRIVEALPTIKYILDKGGKLVIASHCGRPDGQVNEKMRMGPMAARLGELIGRHCSCRE